MKIAIISYGFTGSTLPLAKYLSEKGFHVECFYLMDPFTKALEGIEFDCTYFIPGIKKIKSQFIKPYFKSFISLNSVVLIRKRKKFGKSILNKIIDFIDHITIKKLCYYINKNNFDVINIVGHMYPMDYIGQLLEKESIVYSLHEVAIDHKDKNLKPTPVTLYALSHNIPIIVHSQKTYNDLLQFAEQINSSSNIYKIPFSNFETFGLYQKSENKYPFDYLLFIGYILPYKGIDILYQAYQILKKKGQIKFKIIIAGKGYDPILNSIQSNNDFILLNHYIDNKQFVSLISNCKAIVCPYLSASQSGIPQTAAVFKKYIIASNVGAFPEIIIPPINGLLVKPGDASDLAEAIHAVMLNSDETNFNSIKDNLNKERRITHNWDNICNQYEVLFNKMIKK